ncbi:hypothetical protein TSUD_154660 [Trifolium subterraneum]|uniref:Uncharacterized protein n=1 Tax=Trifolium subterraneum TaxID=3900 RepID=A0A2Z6P7P6_TRISU|nr:hypothetical protein TSUD_154660 [Trifolium subterraneum]
MLAIDTTSGEFIIQHSMQTEVERICYAYGIPPPTYTLQEKRLLDGVPYVRYYGALVAGAIGSPCVSLGRFGRLDDDAREDVAAILIGRLLSVAGHTIRDFNYYNVQQLQKQVKMMKKEILELKYELGIQNEDKLLTIEGSNGKHVSENASPEQATKPNEECITATSNHPAIASSSRLDTKNYEALLSEVASKMVKISSTLYEVVGLVKV